MHKNPTLSRSRRIITWTAQIAVVAIVGMTLPFKFSGAPESVELFTRLGAEPFGRLALAGFESLAVLLLLIPRTAVFGGLLSSGLLTGAVLAHLTILGIVYPEDASLFVSAVVGLMAGLTVVYVRRHEIPVVNQFLPDAPKKVATN